MDINFCDLWKMDHDSIFEIRRRIVRIFQRQTLRDETPDGDPVLVPNLKYRQDFRQLNISVRCRQ